MDAPQSRYLATAARMDEAFLSLVGEKELPYITVKEICARAGVNRSTFYLHYETIGDLLDESISFINHEFMGYFGEETRKAAAKLADCPAEELDLMTTEYLVPYLAFVREHKTVFRTAIERPASLQADHAYKKLYKDIFETVLERLGVPERDRAYLMAFYIQGIMAIVACWLKGDCQDTVEHVASVIRSCVPQFKVPPKS